MTIRIIVNYYPGSVGDAFIAHAFPFIKYSLKKDNSYKLIDIFSLKYTQWPAEISKEEIVKNLEKDQVLPCHRFGQFDFSFIPNVKVISIDPSGYEEKIAIRNLKILEYGIQNIMTDKSDKARIFQAVINCKIWTREQILKTDIVLSLADLIKHQNEYFIEWKNQHNLNELKDLSDEYYRHLKKSLNLD